MSDSPRDQGTKTIFDSLVNMIARRDTLRASVTSKAFKAFGKNKQTELQEELLTLERGIEQLAELAGIVRGKEINMQDVAELQRRAVLEIRKARQDLRVMPPPPSAAVELVTPEIPPEVPLPPTEGVDVERLKHDFIYFCERVLTIPYRPGMNPEHPHGGFGPFVLTSAQRKLAGYLINQLFVEERPVRIVLLKSRQLGCTTLLLAFWVWLMTTRPYYFVMFIIDKDKHAFTKRETIVRWVDSAARFEGFAHVQKKEPKILFLSNGSQFFFESAESPNPGTSEMLHALHESEKPKWPGNRAKQVEESITPGLPAAPFTLHVDESTAMGVDDFKRKWDRAVSQQGSGGFIATIPIFLPWFISEEYQIRPPPDFQFLNEDEELGDVVKNEDGDYTKITEEQYAQLYDLTPAQIYWRRMMIKDKFKGSRVSFDQEYPTTPDHAWRSAASGFFPASLLDKVERAVCDPIFTGRIVDSEGYADYNTPILCHHLSPSLEPDAHGDLEIWEYPEEREKYVVGIDVAEGKWTDTEEGESLPDATVLYVMDRAGKLVALYHGRLRPEEVWLILVLLGILYNGALLAGERNGPGLVVLRDILRSGYPNILARSKPEGAPFEDRAWTTLGQQNRDPFLVSFRSALQADPSRARSGKLRDEMYKFIRKMQGRKVRVEAASGAHDDIILGGAHAENGRLWWFGPDQGPPREIPNKPAVLDMVEDAPGSYTLEDTDFGYMVNDYD